MPGSVLSDLLELLHVIFMTTLHSNLHFTNKEIDTKRLMNFPRSQSTSVGTQII